MKMMFCALLLMSSVSVMAAEKVGTLEMGTITEPESIAGVLWRGDYWINNNMANPPNCLRGYFGLTAGDNNSFNSDLIRGYLLAGYRVSKITASKVQLENQTMPFGVNFSFELTSPTGKVMAFGNTICILAK